MEENNQNPNQNNKINVDLAVEQLEVFLPDHYANLDKLSNLLKTTRETEKPRILELYWREGIEFRADILAALKILRNHYAIEDYGKADIYRKEIGTSTFKELAEAEKYLDLVLDLLHNYQEKTESIEDEILTKEILEEAKAI